MERTLKHLDADNNPIHISFDVDGIDPLYAPGTGTKVKEGLTYNEAMYVCRRASNIKYIKILRFNLKFGRI